MINVLDFLGLLTYRLFKATVHHSVAVTRVWCPLVVTFIRDVADEMPPYDACPSRTLSEYSYKCSIVRMGEKLIIECV